MEVKHPRTLEAAQVIGALALQFNYRRSRYATGKYIVFTPKDEKVRVELAAGGAEGVNLVGHTVELTFEAGVSTVSSLAATVAADVPGAGDVLTVSGDAGTLEAPYAGCAFDLYEERPIVPVLVNVVDDDGNVVPWPGSSISVAVTVPVDRDNDYDFVTVDLGTARAAPGVEVELVGGGSIAGRNLTIWKCTGSCDIKFNSSGEDAHPMEAMSWPSMVSIDAHDFTKVFVTNTEQDGKVLILRAGKKV